MSGPIVVDGDIQSSGLLYLETAGTSSIWQLLEAASPNATNITQFAEGIISPGNSPGAMSIAENYTDHGRVIFEIGGSDPIAEYDVIAVGQSALLDGTVEVVLVDMDDLENNTHPFQPTAGDFFDVLIARQIDVDAAAFDWPTLPVGMAWNWSVVEYDIQPYQSLRLTVTPEPASLAMLIVVITALLCRKKCFWNQFFDA